MRQGKLGRTTGHRKATFRNMVTSLFLYDRIRTTEGKAKEMRPIAEKLITLAKRGDLHARRLAAGYVLDEKALRRLFTDIGPKYAERPGGYIRIVKLEPRRGDAAPEVVVELV